MLRNIAFLALGGLATALPQPATDIPAVVTTPPTGTEPGAAPTRVSPDPTGPTSHGPYSGSAIITGNKPAGPTTVALKFDGPAFPNPVATYYNPDGELRSPAQFPFTPGGGKGVNGTLPRYMVESDFDFESVNLGLHQEFIELDLFNHGLAKFSDQDFIDAGLTAEDRAFIAFMATQEIDHATLLTNMLGEAAPKQCTYDYPFTTVREFIDFNVKLTRWGESGNWGFISHLDSREVATLLVQAESIEARQQMAFRQMLGLHPMPVSFTPGIPQSWHWTFLAPYISSCPANNTRIAWQNFPALHILNTPNPNRVSPNDTAENEIVGSRVADPSISNLTDSESCVHNTTTGYNCSPAISRNKTEPLTFPGRKIFLEWEDAGKVVGPNNSYVTSATAGEPKFLAWVSQINTTYTPLKVTGPNQGWSWQPPTEVYQRNPAVNETVFVAVTDSDLYLTPFNLTLINPHVRALGIFIAG
ncbi:hypothetical protein SLS59_005153 [Nothophoma quercina]|uniref:Rds1 protein n=1 Tax=Nothophoma quercina TaxID=749835 RepID=A0ABR3RCA0_9PLEO